MATYLTAVASMIVLMSLWLAVQRLWRRSFYPEDGSPGQDAADDDALANRSGCHGCKCDLSRCETVSSTLNETTTEVSRHAP